MVLEIKIYLQENQNCGNVGLSIKMKIEQE